MALDIAGLMGMYRCPEEDAGSTAPHYGSFGVCVGLAVISLVVGGIVMYRYNVLKTGSKELTMKLDSMSGLWWAGMFACAGLRSLVYATLFAAAAVYTNVDATGWVLVAVLAFDVLSDFFLSLALHHLSSFANTDPGGTLVSDSDSDDADPYADEAAAGGEHEAARARQVMRGVIAVLAVGRAVGTYFTDCTLCGPSEWEEGRACTDSDTAFAISMGLFGMQQIPALWFLGRVVAAQDGPTRTVRGLLLAAYIVNLAYTVPWKLWNDHVAPHSIAAHPCPLIVMSWFDAVHLLHGVALALYLCCIAHQHSRAAEAGQHFLIRHHAFAVDDDDDEEF
eukprot:TRINITY_DN14600_c0_g1_i1.p1 TRINITY_DN14600_c0_g1~~TRINITY_DN14600_c0_g1_i1.p1  ORF type:complete len:336 (+),score=81.77 TRINITY_DN14600_c0_g1_i1:65-1072(+)